MGGGGWDAVFFTGDIANKGLRGEFKDAWKKMEKLHEVISRLGKEPNWFCVPGNHDLERVDHGKNLNGLQVRNAFTKRWDEEENAPIRQSLYQGEETENRAYIQNAFESYQKFHDAHVSKNSSYVPGLLPGDFSTTLASGGLRIGVVGLNAAFLQLDSGNFKEKLDLNTAQLDAVCGNTNVWFGRHDLAILLTHHPRSWLNPKFKENWGQLFQFERFGLHLFGHAHVQKFGELSVPGLAGSIHETQSAALFSRKNYKIWEQGAKEPKECSREGIHGYAAGKIEVEDGQLKYRVWPRKLVDMGNHQKQFRVPEDIYTDDDHGMKPVTLTSCKKNGGLFPQENSNTGHNNGELKSTQKIVEENLLYLLETRISSELIITLKQEARFEYQEEIESNGELAALLPLQEPDSLLHLVGKSYEICVTQSQDRHQSGREPRLWEDACQLVGFLIHLTVLPEEEGDAPTSPDEICLQIPVETRMGVEIVTSARSPRTPARFTQFQSNEFSECWYAGKDAEGLGLQKGLEDSLDVEMKKKILKERLYEYCCQLIPALKPENVPEFSTVRENEILKEAIHQLHKMGRNIHVPLDVNEPGEGLDSGCVEMLVKELNIPVVQYNCAGKRVLAFPEIEKIQVWLGGFFGYRERCKGLVYEDY